MTRTFTTIKVDTGLLDEAMSALGAKSRTEAARVALKAIVTPKFKIETNRETFAQPTDSRRKRR